METQENAGNITRLIWASASGNAEAKARLMEVAQEELLRRARFYLARERPDHTLQATALVNEMYLRLAGQLDRDWKNRQHFYGVAAQLMRNVLVDYARRHRSPKRGGDLCKVSLDERCRVQLISNLSLDTILALDEALNRLANLDARAAKVVELRFFGDLTVAETAGVVGESEDTVKDDWQFARAWLSSELSPA